MADEKLPPNWREGFDLHMAHLHHGEPHTHRDCPMLIDVLAEFERLRARNEALEKVAKAARKVDEWSFSEAAQTCEECGSLPPNWEALGRDAAALTIALSALAEPGKGGAT